MVIRITYDTIDISFLIEKEKLSIFAEHLPQIPQASWKMYESIGLHCVHGKDYVRLSTVSKQAGLEDRMARLYLFAMWTVFPVGSLKYTFNELLPNMKSESFGNKR